MRYKKAVSERRLFFSNPKPDRLTSFCEYSQTVLKATILSTPFRVVYSSRHNLKSSSPPLLSNQWDKLKILKLFLSERLFRFTYHANHLLAFL